MVMHDQVGGSASRSSAAATQPEPVDFPTLPEQGPLDDLLSQVTELLGSVSQMLGKDSE